MATMDSKVISPAKLAHVVLRTRPEKLSAMIEFYKSFLGAKTSYENDFMSFLTYDDEHHRIAIAAIPELKRKDPQTSGLEHIAFTFASLRDLFESHKQRKAIGIEPLWCVNHGVTLSIYYRDPDGNQIETQVDSFSNAADASAYMAGPQYGENPIGVDFDPDEALQQLLNGASEAEILKRPNIGSRDLSTVPLITVPIGAD